MWAGTRRRGRPLVPRAEKSGESFAEQERALSSRPEAFGLYSAGRKRPVRRPQRRRAPGTVRKSGRRGSGAPRTASRRLFTRTPGTEKNETKKQSNVCVKSRRGSGAPRTARAGSSAADPGGVRGRGPCAQVVEKTAAGATGKSATTKPSSRPPNPPPIYIVIPRADYPERWITWLVGR